MSISVNIDMEIILNSITSGKSGDLFPQIPTDNIMKGRVFKGDISNLRIPQFEFVLIFWREVLSN